MNDTKFIDAGWDAMNDSGYFNTKQGDNTDYYVNGLNRVITLP